MMPSSLSRPPILALCAALATGCSGYEWPVAASSHLPGFDFPASLLLGASDEDDELPPDETVRLLAPEPGSGQDTVVPAPKQPVSRMRFGVRGGMLATQGGEGALENPWAEATTTGLFLRQSPAKRKRMVVELGADYASIETEDGTRTSTLYLLHADLLFGSFGPRGATLYFFLGGHGVMEESVDNATEETQSGQGGGAEAGVGLGSKSGAWDLKATYTYLTATENTDSNLNVTFGLSF
jgi:hypothetical protein